MKDNVTSLSILIPEFNWDCSDLVMALHEQGLSLGIPFEIIVADDCSTERTHIENIRNVSDGLEFCHFLEMDSNLGRAALRNMLAERSRYSKLLFLDCDSKVICNEFLKDYMTASEQASVVCGRIVHPDTLPQAGVELRYRYEKEADTRRMAEIRRKQPYERFTPFSFLIDRVVFQSIRFDVSYTGYGYEDVAFGMELERRNVGILHIDTPLMHLGLETSSVFLEKSRAAIRNAWQHRNAIGNGSLLLNSYGYVKKLHMAWALRILWRMFRKPIEKNLLGINPSLRLFSLYKLCYLCSLEG